jgi:hypothetical protein
LISTIGHTVVLREEEGTWIPSRIYQEVRWLKAGGPIERTHIDKPDLDPNGESAYLGGAEVVCRAMAKLAKSLPEADNAFIGGRPPSMNKLFGEAVSYFTESSVMRDFFLQVLGEERTTLLPFDVTDSCNTETDMRDLEAIARQYDQTIVVCMGFRLPRCRALFESYVRNSGTQESAETARRLTFIDAEQFLPELFDEFVEMNQSQGYRNVMSQERFGVMKLLNQKQ